MDLIQLSLKDPAQKPSSIMSCAAPLSSETGYRDKPAVDIFCHFYPLDIGYWLPPNPA